FAYRNFDLRSVKKRMCLSRASSCALASKVEILANFLQPVCFLFASFLYCTSKREMKNLSLGFAVENATGIFFIFASVSLL
ncbi:MAG: hypothetical protein MJZ42_05010, partial [Bacteroidales bacterium]|nr:hypothetical protein [Bacteroidales bacterium]